MRNDLTTLGDIKMSDGRHVQVLTGGHHWEPVTIAWSRGVGEPSFAMSFTPAELDAFVALLERATTWSVALDIPRPAPTVRVDEWATYGRPHVQRTPVIAA